MSLRDLVIHKGLADIDTYIDKNDKGKFYISLSKNIVGDANEWIDHIYYSVCELIETAKSDIIESEKEF